MVCGKYILLQLLHQKEHSADVHGATRRALSKLQVPRLAPMELFMTRSKAMNHSCTRTSRSHTNRAVFSLRQLGVALLAVAGTAMAQTPAPVGTSTPAEYDCSGLEGVALTSCRQLNAAAVGGALVNSNASPTHDCAGMSGATLATCRDLNGQLVVPVPGAYDAGGIVNGGGIMN